MTHAPSSDAVVVLASGEDPDAERIAAALRRALTADDAAAGDAQPGSAIALPADDEGQAPSHLAGADVAVVLDDASLTRARDAGVARIVALAPRLTIDFDDLDVDLVLVPHEALIDDALERGAPRGRVESAGPIAPLDWCAKEDRDALRQSLELRDGVPVVVVRAAALERDDLSPALVQLSLVGRDASWLFDVGADPELARSLRRHVPGYGLDARMFADGPDALGAYQSADLVLGGLDGPEVIRAFAVGAALALVRPRGPELRLAHAVESAGLATIADAAATLSVTVDAALAERRLERGRAASAGLDAAAGAERVAGRVRALIGGELDAAPAAGLPRGLERLSEADTDRSERAASEPPKDDRDESIDAELEALRKKLGME